MLNKLSIENFKCIDKEDLSLVPLTLITGCNSSGKSTLLQALMLLIKHSEAINRFTMAELLRHLDEFSAVRNKKNNAKEIQLSTTDSKGNELSVSFTESMANAAPQIKLAKTQFQEEAFPYYFEATLGQTELFYLNANRVGAEELVPISQERKVGSQGQFIFSHFHKIKTNHLPEYLRKPASQAYDVAYQVSQWLSDITDSALELKTELIGDHVRVRYEIKDLGTEVSPFNLGTGVSYLSKVLIICLMAKKGDLVLIENPEIHLHPKSQAMLGKFFAFIANAGIQLVIETHSEHLINRVRYEVSKENIKGEDVVIHYKASSNESFVSLFLNDSGHYIDNKDEGERINFPKGFFDTSVDALLALR